MQQVHSERKHKIAPSAVQISSIDAVTKKRWLMCCHEVLIYMKSTHILVDLLVLEGERSKWKVNLDSVGNRSV